MVGTTESEPLAGAALAALRLATVGSKRVGNGTVLPALGTVGETAFGGAHVATTVTRARSQALTTYTSRSSTVFRGNPAAASKRGTPATHSTVAPFGASRRSTGDHSTPAASTVAS